MGECDELDACVIDLVVILSAVASILSKGLRTV